jgi:hypothetical protein
VGSLADVAYWARGSGLEIVLLVLGSVLLTRLAAWVRGRMIGHVDAHDDSTESLVRSEEAKHRHALIQVLTWGC